MPPFAPAFAAGNRKIGSPFLALIPTMLLMASATFFTIYLRKSNAQIREKAISDLMPYILFFAIYLGALSMMGYYSRRLTLGPYIFLELVFIKFITPILAESFKSSQRVMLILYLAYYLDPGS